MFEGSDVPQGAGEEPPNHGTQSPLIPSGLMNLRTFEHPNVRTLFLR